MRLGLPVLVVVLVSTMAIPTALASPSELSLDLDEGPLAGNATIPVVVRLVVDDFICHEPREFVVHLLSNSTEGVKALFETSELVFQVPARAYYVETYVAEATVNLSVRAIANGQIDLGATFEAGVGPCFAPGGFGPTAVSISRAVLAAPGEPEPNEPEPTDPTPATPATPTPATPKRPPRQDQGCAPDTQCGVIGEFQPPPADIKETPGAAIALALPAIALLALARRKR